MSVKAYINLTTPTDRFRLRLSGGSATLDNLAQVLALRPGNNALRLDPLPALPPTLAGNPLTGAGTTAGGGPGGGAFRAELSYYLYDHLGHTRMVFHTTLGGPASPSYGPEFLADYYPYGRILRQWNPCQQERYLTTHHERDAETGYDYRGARYYDADLGRFLAVDPLAGKRSWLSPFNYVQNNPINRVDPTGASDTIPDGRYLWELSSEEFELFSEAETRSQVTGCECDIPINLAERLYLLGKELMWAIPTAKFSTATRAVAASDDIVRTTSTSSDEITKMLTPTRASDNLTLYRGTTGSESTSRTIFLTDNANVAQTYVRNGGQVVQYNVSSIGAQQMEWVGQLQRLTGIHGPTGQVSTEYQFVGREIVEFLNSIAKPLK